MTHRHSQRQQSARGGRAWQASVRVRLRSAAFEADTADVPAMPTSTNQEVVKTIAPPSLRRANACLLDGEIGGAEVGIEPSPSLGRLVKRRSRRSSALRGRACS
jgi:hypothetical protein